MDDGTWWFLRAARNPAVRGKNGRSIGGFVARPTPMRTVILGGGVGGVTAAVELSRRLAGRGEVVLVDKEGQHFFQPSYPWLMMGWRTPDRVSRPLVRLKARDLKLRQEEVVAIEPSERRVRTTGGDLSYDYLVISLGAQLDPHLIPGFVQAAHHPYDLDGAVRLAEALRVFRGGKVAVGVSRLPFKCPAAPYETAFLMDYLFRKRGIREKVEMEFFTPEPWPTPAAGEGIGKAIGGMMQEREIVLSTKLEMESIDPESRVVRCKGGRDLGYDLLVAVPPHTTSEAVRTSGLAKDGPWIPVDRYTMRSAYDDVYAVGDVTKIPTPSGQVPFLSKAGVFAEGQAKIAAQNIASQIVGSEPGRWKGYGVCFLEAGYGKAGMVRGNFYGEGPPAVRMKSPRKLWHWGKVLFERRWLGRLFR